MKKCSLACFVLMAGVVSFMPMTGAAEEGQTAAPPPAPATQPATPAKAPVQIVETASNANKNEALVSISFDETPLSDVIKAFRDATGANIISSGTNLQGIVSVRLDNVPWRKGLSSILEPQGLQLMEQPVNSGIYVVAPKVVEIPLITQTFTLEHAKADDVAKLFTTTIGKNGTATPFPSANIVIVTATEQQLGECEKILKAIDKRRTQVYIEARFAELSSAASKKLGMKWDSLEGWSVSLNNLSAGMEYNKATLAQYKADSTTLVSESITAADKAGVSADSLAWRNVRSAGGQLSASDFSLTLSAFEEMDGVSVFSNPKVIVANEETANVDMTTKEPNVEVQATRSGTSSDQLDITTKLAVIPGKNEPFVGEAFFSYGISLQVTPRVSPSGLITVQIEPSISELEDYYTITTSDDTPTAKYPIIKMSRMKTVFTMQSGSTAVIGGLSRTTEDNTDSGIPGLRHIPWIGPRLFGWKSRTKQQKEIVIFVTVGIADPDNLKTDVGMPKNAVLSREILSGKRKEPGDQTKEELMNVDTSPKKTSEKKADPVTTPEKAD